LYRLLGSSALSDFASEARRLGEAFETVEVETVTRANAAVVRIVARKRPG
jgi:hypothetical protein